jgi:hypothetical protein
VVTKGKVYKGFLGRSGMEPNKGLKIVAYDDDFHAISQRYLHFAPENDVQIVYFRQGFEDQDRIDRELEDYSIPKNLVTVVEMDELFELALKRKTPEQTGIPFPQDADKYFVDGLGYCRERGGSIGEAGFVPIAAQLPNDKVTIISQDHHACEDAEKLGYSAEGD